MNGVKLFEFSPDHYLRGTGLAVRLISSIPAILSHARYTTAKLWFLFVKIKIRTEQAHRPHQSAAPFTPVDIQGIGNDNGSLYPAEFSLMIARC